MDDRGILLKSGTNEVELAEFSINGHDFGIKRGQNTRVCAF